LAQVGQTINGTYEKNGFGCSALLSSDGQRLAVSAANANVNGILYAGQVTVFDLVGNLWVQVGSTLNGTEYGDHFGQSIALSADGSRLAVVPRNIEYSSFGQVRVFQFLNGAWIQLASDLNGTTFSLGILSRCPLMACGSLWARGPIT
jgi:hypothetical protein